MGINGSNYKIKEFHMENTHTDILFNVNNDSYEVRTNLIGKFNVYNYLTSLALISNLGISVNDIINVTDSINAPVGRAQIIKVGTSIAVIDYAHKPDAVSKIIPLFREVTKGKIITIIGCGGDRDPKKRPIMGNIATSLSDYVILTNDNPRTEDEKLIMKDILEGITTDNYEVIYDRKDAIKKGISMLKDNDCLLILGKGHEDYQIIGRTKIHLSDYEEVIKNINK